MEAIKLTGVSHNGNLIVAVPMEYDEKELEIMIISSKEKENERQEKKGNERNIEEMMSIVGAAKFSDFPITKYDVYDQ